MSIKDFIRLNPTAQQIDQYVEDEARRIVKEQARPGISIVINNQKAGRLGGSLK